MKIPSFRIRLFDSGKWNQYFAGAIGNRFFFNFVLLFINSSVITIAFIKPYNFDSHNLQFKILHLLYKRFLMN